MEDRKPLETGLSADQFQKLLERMSETLSRPKELNPKEQREVDDQIDRDKRRTRAGVELARTEMQAMKQRKFGCTHTRHPMSSGNRGGYAAPRGQGEWTTGGQTHGNGTITMICTRCSWTWRWRATLDEIQAVNDSGLLGVAPPPEEKCLTETCPSCSEFFTKAEYANHDVKKCEAERAAAVGA